MQWLEETTQFVFGTKRGDPLGGILFKFTSLHVPKRCEDRVLEAGLLMTLPETFVVVEGHATFGAVEVLGNTYVDDTVVFGESVGRYIR